MPRHSAEVKPLTIFIVLYLITSIIYTIAFIKMWDGLANGNLIAWASFIVLTIVIAAIVFLFGGNSKH